MVRDRAPQGCLVVEVGRVHHERLALPVANGIPHEQADVGTHVRASVGWDDARHVVVLVHHHERAWALDDLIGVPVVRFERSGQDTARGFFDVRQRSRRDHLGDEFAPGGIRFGPPRQHPIGGIDHTRRAPLQDGTILGCEHAGVKDCRIGLAGAVEIA